MGLRLLDPFKCRSGKIIYFSQQEAQGALRSTEIFRDRGDLRRRERNSYVCPECHFYHLTSQQLRQKIVSA